MGYSVPPPHTVPFPSALSWSPSNFSTVYFLCIPFILGHNCESRILREKMCQGRIVHAYVLAEDFVGMVKTLGPAVIIIPLIAVLENMAIAKAFGKPSAHKCRVYNILPSQNCL
jgi:hypothetical protein